MVAPRGRRSLPLLALVAATLLAPPGRAAAQEPRLVSISLAFAAPAGTNLAGSLRFEPVQEGAQTIVLEVEKGLVEPVRLPAGTRWNVQLEAPGFWAAPQALDVGAGSPEQALRIPVWPLGTLTGKFRGKKGEELPRQFSVGVVVPPLVGGHRQRPASTWDCPVEETGAFRCPFPALAADLVLQAGRFVPVYRWGLTVPAGRELPLGEITLERGASLAGWVAVEGGVVDPEACTARILPLLAPGGGAAEAQRLGRTSRTVPVRKDGFFQIAGLAPGSYTVEVQQPGYAPARLSPVEIKALAETALDQPLVLAPSLRLEIVLAPSRDWLDRPWQVHVSRTGDPGDGPELQPVFRGAAGQEGQVAVPDQPPGRYWITVLDSLGNRLHVEPDLRIEGPADAHRVIEVEVLTVKGTLSLGDEPLAGTLWFGGRSGEVSVKMEADTEGAFHGVLPRGGHWRIDVSAPKPRVEASTSVDVRPDRAGRAALEVVLPDTRLFGRVLTEDGRPAADALVAVAGAAEAVLLRSDEQGEFETRGLPEGWATLSGRHDTPEGLWTAEGASVHLQEGQAVGPVELRLRRTRILSGTVLAPHGPLAGAALEVYPAPPSPGGPDAVRTGLTGEFQARVPASAPAALAVVSPPGYALTAFEIPLDGRGAVLRVGAEAGDLEVALPLPGAQLGERGLAFWLFQNGRLLPPAVLASWALAHGVGHSTFAGERLTLPRLAPGEYRACLGPAGGALALLLGQEDGSSCASGPLGPGERLQLTLSAPDRPGPVSRQ